MYILLLLFLGGGVYLLLWAAAAAAAAAAERVGVPLLRVLTPGVQAEQWPLPGVLSSVP